MPEQQTTAPEAPTGLQRIDPGAPMQSSRPQSPNRTAAKAVDRLLNFYPPLDVGDPEAFIAAMVALFARYPAELHAIATDPIGGIPARLKTLSSIAAIKEVCNDLYDPIARRLAREQLENAPRALSPPPRSPEEQARIDQQVSDWRARACGAADKPPARAQRRAGGSEHVRRIAEDLAARRAKREGQAA